MLHIISRSDTLARPETVPFSGGMIREKGSHFFDLAAWISGSEPIEVFAAGACLIDPGFADHGDVDTAAVTLRFADGPLASFEFSRRTAYGYDEMIEAFGSEGMLESRRQRAGGVSHYKGRHIVEDGLYPRWYQRFEATYVRELEIFLSAVTDQAPVHASLADGLRAQAVAAIRSLAENRSVEIEKIW